jgi:hypothetical protein
MQSALQFEKYCRNLQLQKVKVKVKVKVKQVLCLSSPLLISSPVITIKKKKKKKKRKKNLEFIGRLALGVNLENT